MRRHWGQEKKHPDWEREKGNLLKDLVSIANSVQDKPGYLVYGVEDHRTTREVKGISHSWHDATFYQWSEGAFDPPFSFSYTEIACNDEKTIGVFTIHLSTRSPHVVTCSIGGVIHEGQVWFRRGSKNAIALHPDLEGMFRPTEPMKSWRSTGRIVEEASAYYRQQGFEAVLPRLSDKDNKLAEGYGIAFYPGTSREIWVGEIGGQYEHILMLRAKI